MDEIAHLGVVQARAIDVGQDIIEKMAEILGQIPEDDIPYDNSYDPITPPPSSPINWVNVLGEGHKRKKTRRRRRKTKAKKNEEKK